MDQAPLRFQIEQFRLLPGTGDFFRLRSGEAHQGWIEDIGETTLSFVSGGPLSSYEPFAVPLGELDLESFAYFDENKQRWIDVTWSDDTQRWLERQSVG